MSGYYGASGGSRSSNGGGYRQAGGHDRYNGGGGGGKRGRDVDDEGRQYSRRRNNESGEYSSPHRRDGHHVASQQAAQQLFKERLWNLGADEAYNAAVDLPDLADSIQNVFARDRETVFTAFRIAVTEMPHKLPHYAHLLAHLTAPYKPTPTLADRLDSSTRSDRVVKRLPSRANLPVKPVTLDAASLDSIAPDVEPAKEGSKATKEETTDSEAMQVEDDMIKKDSAPHLGESSPAPPEKEPLPPVVNAGREIIHDLGKAAQMWLDQRKWRNVRYMVWLFAHLSSLPPPSVPVIKPSALLDLLKPFAAVLEEPGLRASRGDECVRIIVEALLRSKAASLTADTDELRDAVDLYLARRKLEKELFGDSETTGQFEDRLESLVSSLSSRTIVTVLPNLPTSLSQRTREDEDPIALPELVVPAELEKDDLLKLVEPPVPSTGLRGDEGVGYEGVRVYLRLFEDETVPETYDPSGAVLRSLIFDIINLYEHNRKEAAAILMNLPKWLAPATFKGRNDDDDDESSSGDKKSSEWILEHLVVESVLTSLFAMPKSTLPPAYYHSLLAELCRLSPSTIAPALGKSVRRLYAGLGNEADAGNPVLDAEGIRRFTEWFSMHLSNFGFAWGWADWAPDMEIDPKHPKRIFVQRVIELEVRLSYYDRIKGTIPDPMLDTGVMAEQGPGPCYVYEDELNAHSAAAAQLIGLLRSKASTAEVETELSGLESALQADHGLSPEDSRKLKLDIAVQTILSVGSRSFSHFLNVLERYLVLLRNLSSSAAARLDLLNSVATFWSRHRQFHLIVLDKLLQYRLIDAADVIAWVFDRSRNGSWADVDDWIALSTTINTVQGRVIAAHGRVEGLLAEEETRRAAVADTTEASMDAEEESEEIVQARSHIVSVEQEWASTIVEITTRFAALLPEDREKDDWETFWLEGWFREFCRRLVETGAFRKPGVLEGIQGIASELEDDGLVVKTLEAAREWSNLV